MHNRVRTIVGVSIAVPGGVAAIAVDAPSGEPGSGDGLGAGLGLAVLIAVRRERQRGERRGMGGLAVRRGSARRRTPGTRWRTGRGAAPSLAGLAAFAAVWVLIIIFGPIVT